MEALHQTANTHQNTAQKRRAWFAMAVAAYIVLTGFFFWLGWNSASKCRPLLDASTVSQELFDQCLRDASARSNRITLLIAAFQLVIAAIIVWYMLRRSRLRREQANG